MSNLLVNIDFKHVWQDSIVAGCCADSCRYVHVFVGGQIWITQTWNAICTSFVCYDSNIWLWGELSIMLPCLYCIIEKMKCSLKVGCGCCPIMIEWWWWFNYQLPWEFPNIISLRTTSAFQITLAYHCPVV